MAVYNGEKYLQTAIDSVIQQSFTDFEVIIVDDCSTDSTPAIISSYRDERIKYIKNKVNLGQTPSLNIALNAAKGKYITRIDADDIYLQGKLDRQYAFMESHPEVAVCGTGGIRIDENGKPIGLHVPPTDPKEIILSIFYRSPIIHVSVIMRKSTVLEMGGYSEQYPYCADLNLWLRLIMDNYTIRNLRDTLVKYREYGGSLGATRKVGPSGKEAAEIIHQGTCQLLNMPISVEDCQDIVFMTWPSSGISERSICRAHLNLINVAKMVFDNKVPLRVIYSLKKLLAWSLIKRRLYLKAESNSGCEYPSRIVKAYFKHPGIIFISLLSYFIAQLITEEKLHFFKKKFSS